MREAPVGWQCASCVKAGHRTAPVVRWRPSRSASGPMGRLGATRVTPMVVVLIVANVVAYLYEQRQLTTPLGIQTFESKYFLVPALVHSHWYSLITAAFLHANGMHILLNMISLAIVGPPVEAEVGRLRFLVIYLMSAVGGSVAFYLLAPAFEAGVGASGAIFGLLGAYFVIAKLRGWQTQSILVLLVVNVIYSFTGGIAWQAHLGGLLLGGLVTLGLMWVPGSGIAALRSSRARSSIGPASHPGHVRRVSEMAQLVQGTAVVIASLVALVLLLQIPPGHVNI